MNALGGCRRCGHVERIRGAEEGGVEVGTCPRCGSPTAPAGRAGSEAGG
jgi:hypothetical protein